MIDLLLYPIYKLGDWLVKRDMERWAKTPYLFDTESQKTSSDETMKKFLATPPDLLFPLLSLKKQELNEKENNK